jgi:hypothetical protein
MGGKVIDHMARLDFDVGPEGSTTLVSYHYEYHDYLQEIGCVDVATARENILKAKRLEEKNHQEAESLKNGAVADLDLEDIDDVADNDPGKYRIDNVIKSMVARLELHNTLAPIQEYGRHQVRATQKKK